MSPGRLARPGAAAAVLALHAALLATLWGAAAADGPAPGPHGRDDGGEGRSSAEIMVHLLDQAAPAAAHAPALRPRSPLPAVTPRPLEVAVTVQELVPEVRGSATVEGAPACPASDPDPRYLPAWTLDRRATAVDPYEPSYPTTLRGPACGGHVVFDVLIGEDGRLDGIVPLAATPGFTEPAVRALRGVRFMPALKGGQAVPSLLVLDVAFNVNGVHAAGQICAVDHDTLRYGAAARVDQSGRCDAWHAAPVDASRPPR